MKLNLLGKSNPKTRLSVLTDICCDVILDRDFMCQHREALFIFGGTKKSLHISNFSSYSVPSCFSGHAFSISQSDSKLQTFWLTVLP